MRVPESTIVVVNWKILLKYLLCKYFEELLLNIMKKITKVLPASKK